MKKILGIAVVLLAIAVCVEGYFLVNARKNIQEYKENLKRMNELIVQNENIVIDNGEEGEEKIENFITLNYTNLDDLKEQNLIPSHPTIGENYKVGSLKLGNNYFNIDYIKECVENDNKTNVGVGDYIINEKLLFLDKDNVIIKEFLLSSTNTLESFIKEFSTFKGKYLVTVSDNYAGDNMQMLEIFDENFKPAKIQHDNTIQSVAEYRDGLVYVNNRYENYYSINEDSIEYIYTTDYSTRNAMKTTFSITENDNSLTVSAVSSTKEGVIGFFGGVV